MRTTPSPWGQGRLATSLVEVDLQDVEVGTVDHTIIVEVRPRNAVPTEIRLDNVEIRGIDDVVVVGVTDNASAQAYLQTRPKALTVLSPPLTDEPYVVAMPVRATGLAARIDATIERLRASGELAQRMGTGR